MAAARFHFFNTRRKRGAGRATGPCAGRSQAAEPRARYLSVVSGAGRKVGMFEGFALEMIALPEATLGGRHGGAGPPVLLLHGHPRTHATWHRVAPLLARRHTVVCPDLRGFGQSSKPPDTPDHAGASKRAKARDFVALMRNFGFARFAIVGHDRGSYTAFRAAMDHPAAITHLGILDGVPIA